MLYSRYITRIFFNVILFLHIIVIYSCSALALYEMHQIQRPKAAGHDTKLALFLFAAFGIVFPIVYLRWRYPIILFVS